MYGLRARAVVLAVVATPLVVACGESRDPSPTTPGPPPAPAGCTSAVTVSTSEVLARLAGGTGEFTVTAGSSCSWTATSSADWIRIRQGAQGVGNGRVVYDVDSGEGILNSSGSHYFVDFLRQASIDVRSSDPTGTQEVRVRQFPHCSTAFVDADASPRRFVTQISFEASGGQRHFFVQVESAFMCPWTTLPPAEEWIVRVGGVPISPRYQRGDGDLHLTIAPNPSTSPRSTTLLAGEVPLTITQSGRN
jgi:hypothetical protein